MIEPIKANNIHEKQLAPHIRKRIRGLNQTNTYSEIVKEVSQTLTATAGEALETGDLACFEGGKLYKADKSNRPASCIITTGGGLNSPVKYSIEKQVVLTSGLTSHPFLGSAGDWSLSPSLTVGTWLQRVGTRIDDNSYILDIQEAYLNV